MELEESVEHARGDVREVERRRACSPDRARFQEHGAEERQIRVDAMAVSEGEPGREKRAGEPRPRGDRELLAVAERALATGRRVELAAQRVPDHRGSKPIGVTGSDRDAPERKSGDEGGRPIERHHDPRAAAGATLARPALLAEEPVLREALADRREDRLLALAIRPRHVVVLLLLLDRAERQVAPRGEEDLAAALRGEDGGVYEVTHRPSAFQPSAIALSTGVPMKLNPFTP